MKQKKSLIRGMRVVVFGGNGKWGRKIVSAFLRLGADVSVVEKETSDQVCHEQVDRAKIIFLAADDEALPAIVQHIWKRLSGKILIDCATNKTMLYNTVHRLRVDEPCTVDICYTHPLVAPTTPLRGQNALIIPVPPFGKSRRVAEEIYHALEMNVHTVVAGHEVYMAFLQFLPHLMQRTAIDVMTGLLEENDFTIADMQEFPTANFELTELAIGRVGIQDPSVSAGICMEACLTGYAQKIIRAMQDALAKVAEIVDRPEKAACMREDLTKLFAEAVAHLDPDKKWRERMRNRTTVIVEALGNLRARSFSLESKSDYPGLLLKICTVLMERNINITAVHSHLLEDESGRGVRFDIGIDGTSIDWGDLEITFTNLNLSFTRKA